MKGSSLARASDVLVVEDDEETRDMLVRILRARGFTTDDAANGEAAIVRCLGDGAAPRGAPRVVLLDLMLPDMDGQQVASAITRSMPMPPQFIVLSAQPQWLITRAAREMGARDSLRKPFDVERLVTSVTRASNDAAPLSRLPEGGITAKLLIAIRTFEARRRSLAEGMPNDRTWADAARVVEHATSELGRERIASLSEDVRIAQLALLAAHDVERCLSKATVTAGAADLDFAITDSSGYALLQLASLLCRSLGPEDRKPS